MERFQQSHRPAEDQAGSLNRLRLNRFLAAAGLGSRRHCDELIAAGQVLVNGQPCTNFATQVEPTDHVKVGHRLVRPAEALTLVLHKPTGFVCTRRDPNATDTIYDLLPAKFAGSSMSAGSMPRPRACS